MNVTPEELVRPDLQSLPEEILNVFKIHYGPSKHLGSLRNVRRFTNPTVLFDFLTDDDGLVDYSMLIEFCAGAFTHLTPDDNANVQRFVDEMICAGKIPPHVVRAIRDPTVLAHNRINGQFSAEPTMKMFELILSHLFKTGSFAIYKYDESMYDAVILCFFPELYSYHKNLAEKYSAGSLSLTSLFNETTLVEPTRFRSWMVRFLCNWNYKLEDPKSLLNLMIDEEAVNKTLRTNLRAELIRYCLAFVPPVTNDLKLIQKSKYVQTKLLEAAEKYAEKLFLDFDDVKRVLNGDLSVLQGQHGGNLFLFVDDLRALKEHAQHLSFHDLDRFPYDQLYSFVVSTGCLGTLSKRTQARFILDSLKEAVWADDENIAAEKIQIFTTIAATYVDFLSTR